jgi:glycosyltransferase involved in cell wall biosynthesis
LTVLLPSPGQKELSTLEELEGVHVLRLKAPQTKDVGYFRRTIRESLMPFAMLRSFRRSHYSKQRWDGVIWYSPSIFHGPFVNSIKKASGCKGYLIIRDIFPEWALDIGLMSKGLPYRFFDAVARYQYSVADVIGVQTRGNLVYFDRWRRRSGRRLEVLKNWLGNSAEVRGSIRLDQTPLAGRKIFVYAGNMGVAQGVEIFLDLAEKLSTRLDVGFVFVGRGSDVGRLKANARTRQLANVIFFDEISPEEIPDLYTQCSVGMVALDPRHKSHNIPGKFLTYMRSGLPVLASINSGNDLANLIRDEQVGEVCESNQVDDLLHLTNKLLIRLEMNPEWPARCRKLFEREFSAENAVRQIVAALSSANSDYRRAADAHKGGH